MTETTKETSTTGATTPASTTPHTDAVRAKVTAAIGTLYDLGTVWAGTGLGYLKRAIENSAHALERTAKAVEAYQERFKKPEEKPAS